MLTTISTMIMACSGLTQNYSVQLLLDLNDNSVRGMLTNSTGIIGASHFTFKVTSSDTYCLKNQNFKLCFNSTNNEANLEIRVKKNNTLELEQGTVICEQQW